jgi:hypothetical protein
MVGRSLSRLLRMVSPMGDSYSAAARAFGLGPEIDITLAPVRSRITLRYCHDVAVNARLLGQVMVIGLTILARR